MKIDTLILLAFTMIISLGCSKKIDQEPTELFSVFRSNTSLINAEELIKNIGLGWEVKETLTIPGKDGAPTISIVGVKIEKYSDIGNTGALHISFFNDRIVSTLFKPDNWKNYKPVLKYIFGKEPELGDEVRLPIRTVISIGKDHENRMFVSWTDEVFSNYALEQSYTH